MAIPCTLHRGVLSFPKCPPHSSSSASTSEYPKNLKNPPTHPKNKKIKTSHIFHLDAYSLNGNPKLHLFLEPEPQPRLSFNLENPNPWKPNLICVNIVSWSSILFVGLINVLVQYVICYFFSRISEVAFRFVSLLFFDFLQLNWSPLFIYIYIYIYIYILLWNYSFLNRCLPCLLLLFFLIIVFWGDILWVGYSSYVGIACAVAESDST